MSFEAVDTLANILGGATGGVLVATMLVMGTAFMQGEQFAFAVRTERIPRTGITGLGMMGIGAGIGAIVGYNML